MRVLYLVYTGMVCVWVLYLCSVYSGTCPGTISVYLGMCTGTLSVYPGVYLSTVSLFL